MNLRRTFGKAALVALSIVLCVSCRSVQLPLADFSAPGWQVRQGQAIWKPTKHRPELAGDLLLATNGNGDFFVQFSKTPFTLATARVQSGAWQIDFGDGHHKWSGYGTPPRRFSWFQLPNALRGLEISSPWKFTARPDDSWRLENPRTGESLEGYLP